MIIICEAPYHLVFYNSNITQKTVFETPNCVKYSARNSKLLVIIFE